MNTGPTPRRRVSTPGALAAALLLAASFSPSIAHGVAAEPLLVPARVPVPGFTVALHKSLVLPAPGGITRVSVGDPTIVDVLVLNGNQVYVVGRKVGSTNVTIWHRQGGESVIDMTVTIDAEALRSTLGTVMPGERDLTVTASGDMIVLGGSVTDAYKVQRAFAVAEGFAGERKVVNLMTTTAPQQVLLEVKIAEVSKNVLNRLGAKFGVAHAASSPGTGWSIAGGFLSDSAGLASLFNNGLTNSGISVDASNKDELVKVLAEPNIVAISGQEGSFLSGGKVFIPVPQGSAGSMTITLEEKEFGIGLRFTPTVLENGRINLKVTPEVSELSTTGVVIDATGIGKTVLPSITTRRASTTVQLADGQTFAIGGLIKSNVSETVARFPGLGQIPILGALFRSSEFQRNRTELIFVVTPHLVQPIHGDVRLPTDSYTEPGQADFFLEGRMEGHVDQPIVNHTAVEPTK